MRLYNNINVTWNNYIYMYIVYKTFNDEWLPDMTSIQ